MKSVSIVLFVLLVGSGAWFVTRGNNEVGSVDDDANADAVPVSRRDLSATVLATGVVRPKVGAEVRVGSRASGVLERLYVAESHGVTRRSLPGLSVATSLSVSLGSIIFAPYCVQTLASLAAITDYADRSSLQKCLVEIHTSARYDPDKCRL